MPRLTAHDSSSAPRHAGDRLAELEERHGDVALMTRTMAGSPSLLIGYLELSKAMKRSRLDRGVSERMSIAVQQELGCATCLDAHVHAARTLGVPDYEIDLAKQATSADGRTAALVGYAHRVHTDPASITAADLDALRDVGVTETEMLDTVGLVALNVLTGTLNLVAGL